MRATLLSIITIGAIGAAACGAKSAGGGGPTPPPPGSKSEALAAFAVVQSVFQHPRCQNCHPAGDAPLQGDDSHPHLQNVRRGPAGRGMVGEECTTCHGPANPPASYGAHTPPGIATGWRMPPPEQRLVFVGVSAHALCEQVKDPERNGGKNSAALRIHLDDPLVTWGWTPGTGRAAIPTSRADFLAAWTTWTAAGAPCPE